MASPQIVQSDSSISESQPLVDLDDKDRGNSDTETTEEAKDTVDSENAVNLVSNDKAENNANSEATNNSENNDNHVNAENELKALDGWGNWPSTSNASGDDNSLKWPNDENNDVQFNDPFDIDMINTDRRFEQFKLYDPLPKRTALGLSTLSKSELKEKDNSPYPPPEPDQRRFNTQFPAPRPPTEEERHPYLRIQFFEDVHDDVAEEMKKADEEKAWFETFIREKIQFNVVETNLDKVNFSKLFKGLSAGKIVHKDFAKFKNLITCNLCEQIAILPKICDKCIKPYCLTCIRWLQGLPSDLELEKVKGLDEFLCVTQTCLIAVERHGYPKYKTIQNTEIRKFLEEATFKCIHQFCEANLKINQLAYHYYSCKKGPIDFKFDKTLQLSFYSGPIRAELNSRPIAISSLMPAHLKKQEAPMSIPEMWHRKALVYAFLVQKRRKDPNSITPIQMRNAANFGNGYWNNYQRIKDPTAPLCEAEDFALKLGFPSCSEVPIPEVERRWPMVQCSRVPTYLLKESANWRRWSKYIDPIPDDVSETSSTMLYALDIEDPESPFIRINPFERLSPSEAEDAMEQLAKHFPSCFNPRSIYKKPVPKSENQWTIHCVNKRKKKLAEAFEKRPKANLPPMLEEQINCINELASNCPDRHTIFSINMFYIRIYENHKLRPRPCWVAIVDGDSKVVYETFVHYKEIDYADAEFHGLTVKDLQNARPLHSVRDQVLKYLVCGSKIIGCGLINQFLSLGLTRFEIMHLHPKLREITNFYSPYFESPMTLHAVAFLWFCGYALPAIAHSPVVEAITSLRLYFLQWQAIERKAFEFKGIHNENAANTCGNKITSALLKEFQEGIEKGLVKWPEEWKNNPRISKYPRYDEHCVHPSKFILHEDGSAMAKPDFRKTQENLMPQSRSKRILHAIRATKISNLTDVEEETEPSTPTNPEQLSPAHSVSESGSYHTPESRSRRSSQGSKTGSRHGSRSNSREGSKNNSKDNSRSNSRRSSVSSQPEQV